MGAEYLAFRDENQVAQVGHYVEIALPGEVNAVRDRLVRATGQLGYLVIEEVPIIARCTKSKYSSSSILDYIDTLTIRLKGLSAQSTRAIFEYKYANVYGKSAKAVLTRQANAIAALANANLQPVTCPSCGAAPTDASRFCRQCGASMAFVPAEVDLMQIVADSHAGYLLVLQGTVGFFLSFVTLLAVLAIKGPSVLISALVFTLIFAIPSFIMMLFGIRRLRRTVKNEVTDDHVFPRQAPELDRQPALNALSDFTPQTVTEGTTELLHSPFEHSLTKPTDKLENS